MIGGILVFIGISAGVVIGLVLLHLAINAFLGDVCDFMGRRDD